MDLEIKRTTLSKAGGLIFWIGICYLAAWISAQVSPGIAPADWYNSLNKPSWNPPGWVFGPVWTTLYTLMGIAAWLVWKKFGFQKAKPALIAFIIQLILNGIWSQLFFGLKSPGWAIVEIFFLLAAILLTTALFSKKVKTAAWLMVPYILWVGFAAVLNGTIWWINA